MSITKELNDLQSQSNENRKASSLFKSTQSVVHEALNKLGYSDDMFELLKEPIRMLTVHIPVRMDDGKVKIFTGYRAQHNDAVGPTKGGVRFHPDVNEEEVKALSLWMS
ncbi:glutamate dehydrogenase [Alteribacillus bidgolensis]|uniref:Glutamate dehydrogenase n=1 Tax=Alteribacillus bidgolensis TaxID=930129 RepID=A0A1G8HE83_9BACI|nr:glutamate dehydrogenase [Alteribacillus bidgolensis]